MKRIVFVGDVGAGKTTLFNALQGDFDLARKTQAIEFNDEGSVDTRVNISAIPVSTTR